MSRTEDRTGRHSTQPAPAGTHVVVTSGMIEAGLEELSDHHYAGDTAYMVESVYRAMAYASFSASATNSSK